MKDIGKMIKSLRIERHMTQDKLAEKIGVTKQTISNYERGSRRPAYEELEAICDVMNVPMSFFLTDEEREKELQDAYAREGVLARTVRPPRPASKKKTELDEIIDRLLKYQDGTVMSPDEQRLINLFRSMTPKQQEKTFKIIDTVLDD